MSRFSIDPSGVSRERIAVADDPRELRECASLVAGATAAAMAALGGEGEGVRAPLERFRVVHCHALDGLADAVAALGDRLDRSTLEARSVELFVTAGFAQVASTGLGGNGSTASPEGQ